MARTHMHNDLAASDTLPITSGWKSDSMQNWPILFNTRAEILFLSKLIKVFIKLESPAKKNSEGRQLFHRIFKRKMFKMKKYDVQHNRQRHALISSPYPTASWPLPKMDLSPEGS